MFGTFHKLTAGGAPRPSPFETPTTAGSAASAANPSAAGGGAGRTGSVPSPDDDNRLALASLATEVGSEMGAPDGVMSCSSLTSTSLLSILAAKKRAAAGCCAGGGEACAWLVEAGR